MKKNSSAKKKSLTLDDLAVMVQQGFEEARRENDERFTKLEKGQANLERGFAKLEFRQANLERGQTQLEFRQANLERGQEEIQLRLTNVAYRIDFVALEKRVQKVEDIVLRKRK